MMKPVACSSLAALFGCLASLNAQAVEPPKPGSVFKDCKNCPEMVVLPAGSFVMGTPEDEVGREPDEGPQHTVTFNKAFAMSRFHVTAGELDAYIRETGTVIKDGDERPGRLCQASKPRYEQGPRQPAVCVDYADVQAYARWLSKKTGQHYRMISEAEREYAARAGSSGSFPFPFDEEGQYQITQHANTYGPKDGYSYSAPVGSYPPNAFGMYDMHGNVYEWVADCWHPDYVGAPADGRAWMEESGGVCLDAQIRGNDWGEAPVFSRSGNRNSRKREVRGDWLSFRVVRELEQPGTQHP
ncbi:PvdO, pyoverdine responsive serine/threonine kinase (predicted by OlgaV) [Pseudomonas chlororaphis subsp. aureofaciens]|uniref:PvdO, pyoverdine responsive serine/threonine kinase (Predicted by OlgaV) n=2 Tax=Pseudomonas TaxID=286 RepID=A0AAD0ZR80_9PSED|nr:PvdO, pyoverdine responsive serine/threonine kinase (predicted by OlgaV) [Pseudomonas chlororaphis subsp. aureofaciens]AZE24775.1 PvdO, pyoverdine responsive serine/threonine kinase (predicted by OlgaV) [Pseudomonas chlororaphis subsp. aureofaciens]AZE30976.1 PvdO, pyoverdine responsive serine/threonine kinase (predicted by OlgaV) [Pseudomonas chlororaphis subsp. aureofaciens]AZE37291.1 PvdO, pyoverdine responsive serine/threonine kinase (predicted by OlgaV) [Pseudomonas chlororaphis subsp. a